MGNINQNLVHALSSNEKSLENSGKDKLKELFQKIKEGRIFIATPVIFIITLFATINNIDKSGQNQDKNEDLLNQILDLRSDFYVIPKKLHFFEMRSFNLDQVDIV